jgi:hypothetical protein
MITENFPNLEKAMHIQVQEASGTPKYLTKIELPYNILSFKKTSTENRERILKHVRQKKQITYKDKPIKITEDILMENIKAR